MVRTRICMDLHKRYSQLSTVGSLTIALFTAVANPLPGMTQTIEREDLNLDPGLVDESPVLQRWLEDPPDVLEDIRYDPAFRTRLRIAYVEIDDESGISISAEDIFLGDTGLTLNADYVDTFEGNRHSWGMSLRYYTLPLGNRVNISPLLGYRDLETPEYSVDGVEIGLRLVIVPSRTGAADLSLSQSWVNPGSNTEETSLSTFTAGYALTQDLRLSSDIQIQLTPEQQDTRFGIGLELML